MFAGSTDSGSIRTSRSTPLRTRASAVCDPPDPRPTMTTHFDRRLPERTGPSRSLMASRAAVCWPPSAAAGVACSSAVDGSVIGLSGSLNRRKVTLRDGPGIIARDGPGVSVSDGPGVIARDSLGGIARDSLGGIARDSLGGIARDSLGGIARDSLGGIVLDRLGGTVRGGHGRRRRLAPPAS